MAFVFDERVLMADALVASARRLCLVEGSVFKKRESSRKLDRKGSLLRFGIHCLVHTSNLQIASALRTCIVADHRTGQLKYITGQMSTEQLP